ncbi:MAG: OmpA family protein [Ignavibacterium sp.]|jgi:outer membrane protein OmpA-like peptidoglycan-associated protein|uniref:OmpA family protein n=1 Tax=Ignavibacterium sp. TaxID=2651167 RepID=UPI00329A340F
MKNILLLFIFILFYEVALPQDNFKHWGHKIGIRSNLLFPQNEFTNFGIFGNDDLSFKWFKFSHLFQAFYGYEISKTNELHINVGHGFYAGRAYDKKKDVVNGTFESSITPIDLRLRIVPTNKPNWNPYFYLGIGLMYYEVTKSPDIPSPVNPKLKGWTGIYPFGVGAEFVLSEKFVYDISFGGALSSSLDLDGYWGENNFLWDGYFNISIGVSWRGETCQSDRDNDGLTKCEEQELGTDIKNPDSDGDKISDGDEVKIYKTNPLSVDSDNEGLNDYDEIFVYKTNPVSTDTDLDQIDDRTEIFVYKTDPLKSDSDSDGLSDYEEIFVNKTNPNNKDTDDDGLSDGDEVLVHKTNPLVKDTDEDKLTDGDEVLRFKTDPTLVDSDGDTLSDFEEVNVYKSDPNKLDTDEGGIDDGTEIANDTNPLNPKDDIKKKEVIEVGVPIVLEGITFDKNKATIKPESEPTLWDAYTTLKNYPEMVVEISGHTDNVGSRKSNIELSIRRANAVKDWLVKRGIEPERIQTKGYGPDRPVAPNNSEENKRKNRRIEFLRLQ